MQAFKSWHLLAIFANTVRFKQPRKQQSWLNFVFLSSKYFWFFLDWCSDVFVPSVFINETLFFLNVFLNKIYLVWNQVVGTLLTFYFKHVLDSKFHWRSFQSVDQFDSVISIQYLIFGAVLRTNAQSGFRSWTVSQQIWWHLLAWGLIFFFLIDLRFLSNV